MGRTLCRLALLASILAWTGVMPATAHAWQYEVRSYGEPQERGRSAERRQGMSLEAAASLVQRRTGGRVLSADVEWAGGQQVYRFKVLTPDGRVRIYRIDPESGALR